MWVFCLQSSLPSCKVFEAREDKWHTCTAKLNIVLETKITILSGLLPYPVMEGSMSKKRAVTVSVPQRRLDRPLLEIPCAISFSKVQIYSARIGFTYL